MFSYGAYLRKSAYFVIKRMVLWIDNSVDRASDSYLKVHGAEILKVPAGQIPFVFPPEKKLRPETKSTFKHNVDSAI